MGSSVSRQLAVRRVARRPARRRCTCGAHQLMGRPREPDAVSSGSQTEESGTSGSTGHLNNRDLDVPDDLQCPICYIYVYKPIYVCANGHKTCGECQRRIRNCPMCRSEPLTRDPFVEAWASSYYIPCRYAVFGCQQPVLGRKMEKHLSSCLFRFMICSICAEDVPSEKFWTHLINKQAMQSHCASDFTTRYLVHPWDYLYDEFRWNLRWMVFSGTNFLCHFEKFGEEWCFWVTVERNSLTFACEISFFSTEKRKQIKYEGPVNKLRTGVETVLRNGQCLVLDAKEVDFFMTRLRFADLRFRIWETPEGGAPPLAHIRISCYKGEEYQDPHANKERCSIVVEELPLPEEDSFEDNNDNEAGEMEAQEEVQERRSH